MSDPKKKPDAKKDSDPSAWVAQCQLSFWLDGAMHHFVAGQDLPKGITEEAIGNLKRTDKVVRRADYTGPVLTPPIAMPQPQAILTADSHLMVPVLRDQWNMISPNMDAALPDDPVNFRVDKSKPSSPLLRQAAVPQLAPGESVEVFGGIVKDQDGIVSAAPSRVLRNTAKPGPPTAHAATCLACDADFPDIQAMKVHESVAHRDDSFHDFKERG